MKKKQEQIMADIIEQLKWDNRVHESDIKVEMVDHTVVLSGTVGTATEKIAAEADVRSIPGISNVDNRLEIRRRQEHTDDKIGWNVKSMLTMTADFEAFKIEVAVHNHTVTLRGSVDEYWKKMRVEEQVAQVPGVSNVVNTLTVVPTNMPYDQSISQDILKALERVGTIDTEKITIEVNGGRVTIKGRVPDWHEYSTAHNIVKYTKGVTDLVNNLVILSE